MTTDYSQKTIEELNQIANSIILTLNNNSSLSNEAVIELAKNYGEVNAIIKEKTDQLEVESEELEKSPGLSSPPPYAPRNQI